MSFHINSPVLRKRVGYIGLLTRGGRWEFHRIPQLTTANYSDYKTPINDRRFKMRAGPLRSDDTNDQT